MLFKNAQKVLSARHFLIIVIIFVTILIFSLHSSANDYIEYIGIDKFYDRLENLSEYSKECLDKKNNKYLPFNNCIDWSTTISSYWLLFRVSRVTGKSNEFAKKAHSELMGDNIKKEQSFLEKNPSFEMPYGRSWFLRLAIEEQLWCESLKIKPLKSIKIMAVFVAKSIEEYYTKNPPNPNIGDNKNDTWAIIQLFEYYKFTNNINGLKWINDITDENFISKSINMNFDNDKKGNTYFSVFGNLTYLLIKIKPIQDVYSFIEKRKLLNQDLLPVTDNDSGILNWSRAWAFLSLARISNEDQGEKVYLNAFRAHVEKGFLEFDRNIEYSVKYAYKTAPFAVYTLTEGM